MTIEDVLGEWDHGLRIVRRDRAIAAIFKQPHTVLGSAMFGSGLRDDLQGALNVQTCDAKGLDFQPTMAFIRDDAARMAEGMGLDPGRVVTMGTAASMRCHGLAEAWYADAHCPQVGVIAVATAGVEGNAGRAGDPTAWYEVNGEFYPRTASPSYGAKAHAQQSSQLPGTANPRPEAGTINIMVCCSAPLHPTAFGRAIITATEAKSAVLADYAVGSLYSPTVATGTGTDQIVVAAPTNGPFTLSGLGHHAVMGELLASTVMDAVRAALRQQNGMTPTTRCNLLAQCARFGLTQDSLLAQTKAGLTAQQHSHLANNVHAIVHDPVVVALGAAMATAADQLRVGVLPVSASREIAARLGIQMALAICTDRVAGDTIAPAFAGMDVDPATLIPHAIAIGWANRWDWSQPQAGT